MSVHQLLTAAGAAPLDVLRPSISADAHAVIQSADAGAYDLTAGRFWATAAALLGLAGVVLGGLAMARSVRRIGDGGRRGAIVALAAGVTAMTGGTVSLAVADGGPGTGNGVVGAALALVLGLLAVGLGGLVMSRSRRAEYNGAPRQ